MKKLITFVAVGVLMLSTQVFGQGFTINGTVEGVSEGKVTLQARGGDKYATGIENGKFALKGKVTTPTIHTLRIEGIRGSAQIFVENSKMTFKANKDDLRGATVTGSDAHDVYTAHNEALAVFNEKSKPLSLAYSEARKNENEAEMEKIMKQFDELRAQQTDASLAFIKENNKSIASAYILSSMASRIDDPAKLEAAVNSLDKSLFETTLVKNTVSTLLIAKKTAIGQPAMDFSQNDPDGKAVKLSDFKGQVVLVDFWASWCGPCRAENPNVVEAFKKFKSKGFTVLGVSLDKEKDKWLQAIEKDELTWTHVSDLKYWDNEVSTMYGVRGIPANILVGKDGKILAKNLRGKDLHEKLAEVL